MIPRAMLAGALAPGRFNNAGLFKGEGPDKGQPQWSSREGHGANHPTP